MPYALFCPMSVQRRWAGFRKITICLHTVFCIHVFQPVRTPPQEGGMLLSKMLIVLMAHQFIQD